MTWPHDLVREAVNGSRRSLSNATQESVASMRPSPPLLHSAHDSFAGRCDGETTFRKYEAALREIAVDLEQDP